MNTLNKSLLFFYTETPLHAGSGRGLGAIDLPLQRERLSELPQVHGSGVKGALRELFRAPEGKAHEKERELEETLFGPRPPDPLEEGKKKGEEKSPKEGADKKIAAHEHAGALAVSDARLLLLPVRSARGGWAWITSPLILQRLARDLGHVGDGNKLPGWANLRPGPEQALVASTNASIVLDEQLVLEDALYQAKLAPNDALKSLARVLQEVLPQDDVYNPVRQRLPDQLAILSDEEMCYWARHGTEVVTRVRIDPNTGTVAKGALWTEELLPSESLMWSLVMISNSRKRKEGRGSDNETKEQLADAFDSKLAGRSRIFLGGDRTIGRGLVALGRKEAQ